MFPKGVGVVRDKEVQLEHGETSHKGECLTEGAFLMGIFW